MNDNDQTPEQRLQQEVAIHRSHGDADELTGDIEAVLDKLAEVTRQRDEATGPARTNNGDLNITTVSLLTNSDDTLALRFEKRTASGGVTLVEDLNLNDLLALHNQPYCYPSIELDVIHGRLVARDPNP